MARPSQWLWHMSGSSHRSRVDPATDAALLLSRIGLALVAVAAPCAAMGARRAIFILMPVGTALILVAALLGAGKDGLRHLRDWLVSPIGLAALFLAFWTLSSLAWTPFRVEAAGRFGKMAGTVLLAILAAAFLPERTRTSNLYLLPLGAALAAIAGVLVLFEGPALLATVIDGDDSTLERGMEGLVVLLWPALCALGVRERWKSAAAVAALVAAAALIVKSPLGLAGLVTGMLVFALAVSAPRAAGRILAASSAILLLAAPALPLAAHYLPPIAALQRNGPLGDIMASLDVWRGIVLDDGWRLVTGHGVDSVTRGLARNLLPPDVPGGILFEIWFELGLVGAAAMALLASLSFAAAGGLGPRLAPFLLAGLSCCMVMASVNLGAAQLWWVSILGIAGIAFTHALRGEHLAARLPARQANVRIPAPV